MVIDNTTVSQTSEDHNRDSASKDPENRLESGTQPLSGGALVIGYIGQRAQEWNAHAAALPEAVLRRMQDLEAENESLKGVEKRAEELQRLVESLKTYSAQLEETVRQLQIGFRRHTTERVSPDQLNLILAAESKDAQTPGAQTPGAQPDTDSDATPPQPTEEQTPQAPAGNGEQPANRGKKRDNHGRRQTAVIPKVIIEVLPVEVILGGLSNFDRIGQEDSPVIGYRRGGQVEVLFRRLKFVPRRNRPAVSEPRDCAVSNCNVGAESDSDACAVSECNVAAESDSDASAVSECNVAAESDSDACAVSESEGSATVSNEPIPSSVPNAGGTPVVLEHEVLMVPQDTSFKRSPFVDGAIVRYLPDVTTSTDVTEDNPAVLIAPPPERPIEKGMADASLLAHLLVQKQEYHVPYYRLEVQFERLGWPISRANMARWQYDCGELAMAITSAMWHEALSRSWFAMDATGTAIRDKDANRYGHVFVLVAPGDGVLFRFAPKYDAKTVEQMFGGYRATIVADASANHNILFGPGKNREAGCWAHGRKPFVKAIKAGEGVVAAQVLTTIQQLFKIEERIALCSPQERLCVRQLESAPLVDGLFAQLEYDSSTAVDHTLTRKGIRYLLNQKQALREFLSNGEIPIHNNASERALRRVVKGRINWLFHGSNEHAERACAISSLIASCAIHGLDPELYLQEVLTVAPTYPAHAVLDLSPKNWVATRQRLIAEGRLKYIDLARLFGSTLAFRSN